MTVYANAKRLKDLCLSRAHSLEGLRDSDTIEILKDAFISVGLGEDDAVWAIDLMVDAWRQEAQKQEQIMIDALGIADDG
jgi:protein-disulfide isomerase-like protein with CxxC motif